MPYCRAVPLTFLIVSGLAAQSQNLSLVPLLRDASTPSALNRSSSSSIQLQNVRLGVAISAPASPHEDLIVSRLDADASGGSLSSTNSYSNSLVQAAVPEALPPDLTANPGRPALATSALLTPIGYAQFETGYLYAGDSAGFSSRNAEEETMRVTVSSRIQLIVAAEPVAASNVARQESSGRGDTTGGIQVVLMPGQAIKPTISVSYLRLMRGGNATDLDIGGYANSALFLASADLGHFHVDANGFLNETEGPVRRAQFGQAVAVTHPITPKLSATAELRHFTEPLGTGEGLSAMWAGGYALRPNLVFDTGLVRGFANASTRWQVASGVTYVLPRRIWGFSHP